MAKGRTPPRRRGAWVVPALGSAVTGAVFAALLSLDLVVDPKAAAHAPEFVQAVAGRTLAALVAGVLLSGLFGRAGLFGWLVAFVAGALVTLLGGALGPVGSALVADPGSALPLLARPGTLIAAALAVPRAIAEAPVLALLWAALIGGVHTATGWARTG